MTTATRPVFPPRLPPPIPWASIIAIEPRVQEIIDDAALLGGGSWDDYGWYASLLGRFTGSEAADVRLRDHLVYCEATRRLVEALNP